MAGGWGVPLALLAVLTLQRAGALRVRNTIHQFEFQQRIEAPQQENGEYQQSFNADEVFHVDRGSAVLGSGVAPAAVKVVGDSRPPRKLFVTASSAPCSSC